VSGVKNNPEQRFDLMTIAGTPEEMSEEIARQMDVPGRNYFIARLAYGELSHRDSVASLDSFAEQVMTLFEQERAPA